MPNSHDKAIAAFESARKLAPTDIRTTWFHANLLCQTNESEAGAAELLDLEATHPRDQLPADFWGDYMYCAAVANMPAHVLRAASYLDKLHAPQTGMRSQLVEIARKRFDVFDPGKKYDSKEVWQAAKEDDAPRTTADLSASLKTG